MLDIYNYEKNAAFDLTEEQRRKILNYFDMLHKRYERRMVDTNWLDPEFYNLHREAFREIKTATELLERIGINIAYNWPGHRGEYFFPTYNDALAYEDWLLQCAEEEKYYD